MIWGLYFAVFLILEKFFLYKYLNNTKIIKHIYLLLIVILSFVIFDGGTLTESITNIRVMFGLSLYPLISDETIFMVINYGVVILLAIIGATGIPALIASRLDKDKYIRGILNVAEPVFIGILIIICTSFLVNGSFNPFLYFRF